MIPVKLAKEPPEFDADVRKPGLRAIDEMIGRGVKARRGAKRAQLQDKDGRPIENAKDIPPDKFPPYWRKALPKMLDAYERRCAYLAMYIHHATGSSSVDHVLPKSYAWDRVYEWDNFRLCAQIINSKKGALLDLIDPFCIGPGWFALNIHTFHVERGPAAPEIEWSRIEATLPILNHRLCVSEREEYVRCYRIGPGNGGFDFAYLESRAPFIASELRRQEELVRGDT